ncbi:predicted protein [Nematostella vectensis]|uniref:F5/8 type C domain-containing protein n=2 Tax=Nematostella vectensis TaxID=45351 RepID=A7RXG4_NEMVE|nr:predicted protein [Nematostella vectensis]|eukprot:XP_001635904.1 predicted protein [Nematostella vectensis]
MEAHFGRLNAEYPSWAAKHLVEGEYLQVDLGRDARVGQVSTQGSPKWELQQWVTSYRLAASDDGTVWMDYQRDEGPVVRDLFVFQANQDPNGIVTNTLRPRMQGRSVRVVVLTYNIFISLRIELYGCYLH